MNTTNTGILTEVTPLTEDEIDSLEETLLSPGDYVFYTDKNFKVYVLGATEPPYDFKDIAWHEFHRIKQQNFNENTTKIIKTIFYPSKIAKYRISDTFEKKTDENTGKAYWQSIYNELSNRLDEALLDVLKLG
jgi:hypothetical protein